MDDMRVHAYTGGASSRPKQIAAYPIEEKPITKKDISANSACKTN